MLFNSYLFANANRLILLQSTLVSLSPHHSQAEHLNMWESLQIKVKFSVCDSAIIVRPSISQCARRESKVHCSTCDVRAPENKTRMHVPCCAICFHQKQSNNRWTFVGPFNGNCAPCCRCYLRCKVQKRWTGHTANEECAVLWAHAIA